ncbi:hypothetical protein COCC4DRAFT_68456 [Bipolaris maydis ATCC 48331]|uniref:Uncharacterized protein n=3 Tax=Cochliobolus heterostrophus TaxID=5016 RepID=N4XUU2_COCH4|nr:uncharacterized protein COCC4DRAFT_68456 [Bipolaris maydis ATCC 48331]ENI10101.1 hypothetical protein COCC4DRAFT_68456 [Bipolaris maydis ATCC 48331]KAJ5025603.1 hypothetical protein J3E73DRAFT_234404 [Bipolaris maydis]
MSGQATTMATNAPYYQMRSGQFITTSNSTNAAPPQFVAEDEEYDLGGPAVVTAPLDHHLNPHLYAEHTAQQTSVDHTLEENHNLVELLEAATAAGHAAQVMDASDTGRTTPTSQGRGKRKRPTGSPVADSSLKADEPISTRRRRLEGPTDPRLQDGICEMGGDLVDDNQSPSSEPQPNNARTPGVHSAAALFRRSSERTARKHTRPPMSKLFISLRLSPENFLQLQASAKAYMLDSSYPERQSCVGNRGKGDNDMVKLRLFNCVRDFLSSGVGERFFGEHVQKPEENDTIEAARALGEMETPEASPRLIWPRDGNKIIGLVTPLMRRMVTNERQRQYAIETRKGGSKQKEKESNVKAVTQQDGNQDEHRLEHHLQPAFDPNLHPCRYSQAILPSSPTSVALEQRSSQDQVCLAGLEQKTHDHVTTALSSKLSRTGTTNPNLRHINIFLVGPSSGTTSDTKIGERRIAADPQSHLAWYDYSDFVNEVVSLLQNAMDSHPELESWIGPLQAPGNNLRGLAAAANALQTEDAPQGPIATSKCTGIPPADDVSAALLPPASAPALRPTMDKCNNSDTRLLSRFVIKSIGPEGWRHIRSADDWYSVLREKAFAVWADGICNVLVELVDPSAMDV